MKHADILIWYARKELSVQVKHADILIRYARKKESIVLAMYLVMFLTNVSSQAFGVSGVSEYTEYTVASNMARNRISIVRYYIVSHYRKYGF